MIFSLEEKKVKKIQRLGLIIAFLIAGNVLCVSTTYADNLNQCVKACSKGEKTCLGNCRDLGNQSDIQVCQGFCSVFDECRANCREYFKK